MLSDVEDPTSIDTGVDYTHPLLGGKFGPGQKIAGGKDFVGDNYTNGNPPVPDDDPVSTASTRLSNILIVAAQLDQCNGHGTHVAGVIGAESDNDFDFSGIAPDAYAVQSQRRPAY